MIRHSLWIVCVVLGKLSIASGVKLTSPNSGWAFSSGIGHQGSKFFNDFHGALDGIDPLPLPAAVRLLAPHDHEHVDPSLIAQPVFPRAGRR